MEQKLKEILSESGIHVELDEYAINRIKEAVLNEDVESKNYGYFVNRIKSEPREKVFHEKWKKENQIEAWINYGNGILQDIFCKRDSENNKVFVEEINTRDRKIVATVIQWLGTNCGMAFIEDCLREIKEIKR